MFVNELSIVWCFPSKQDLRCHLATKVASPVSSKLQLDVFVLHCFQKRFDFIGRFLVIKNRFKGTFSAIAFLKTGFMSKGVIWPAKLKDTALDTIW